MYGTSQTDPLIAAERRRGYHTLDALRGVAAILIVPRHTFTLFGTFHQPETFLAVDLFFLMSAVVLASAYDEKLRRTGNFSRFFLIRVVRLWPLYLLALGVGALQFAAGAMHRHQMAGGMAALAPAILAALVMLPAEPSLVGTRWSLTYEMLANVLYGACRRFLTVPILIIVAVAGVGGMIATELRLGGLDYGYKPSDWEVAVWRLCYSFSAGLVLQKVFKPTRRSSWLWSLITIAASAAALCAEPQAGLCRQMYELAVVIFGFPLIVMSAMTFDPPPILVRACTFLGVTSYAVYLLHEPLALIYMSLLRRVYHTSDAFPILPALAFIPGLLAICWMLDRFFDIPLRRRIETRLKLRRWN